MQKRKIKAATLVVLLASLFGGAFLVVNKDKMVTAHGHVVINEACSNNFSVIQDEAGKYFDYVELYNPTDADPGTNLYLTDDRDDLKKYKIEESVPAGGYLIIWLSGIENEDYLHAPFKLSDEGEYLILTDEAGNMLDEVRVPSLEYNVTYSRRVDGKDDFYYAEATPGTSNENAAEVQSDYNDSPVFSLEDGFYDIGTNLTIKGNVFDKIYYTTDGSVPDEESLVYSGPITLMDASDAENSNAFELANPYYNPPSYKLDKANVIRAVAVNRFTGKRSKVETHVYFCGFDKKPDYEDMEVVSLVLDPDDLFGYEDGIYALGAGFEEYRQMAGYTDLDILDTPGEYVDEDGNVHYSYEYSNSTKRGRKSEKEAVMSVFDKEHQLYFSQDIGVRIAGESSRSAMQKAFNLFARSEYDGEDCFKKPFFVENEKKVRLRNDGYVSFQEAFVQRAAEDIGLLTQRARPCAVFLNGEYWGVYDIRQQYDERYFATYCDLDEANLWVRKNDSIEYGSSEAKDSYEYIINMMMYADASNDEVYEEICNMIDIDNLIDYFCFLLFFDEEDIVPGHNQIAFRSASEGIGKYEDCRWRFLVFDKDETICDPSNNTIALYRELGEDMYLPGLLYENEQFRERFVDRMNELVNGPFSYDVLHQRLVEWDSVYRSQNIDTLMRYQNLEKAEAEYEYEKTVNIFDDFFKQRKKYLMEYLKEDLNDFQY